MTGYKDDGGENVKCNEGEEAVWGRSKSDGGPCLKAVFGLEGLRCTCPTNLNRPDFMTHCAYQVGQSAESNGHYKG